MKLPENDIVNPYKHREYIDDDDVREIIDRYLEETKDLEALEKFQSMLNAHRAALVKKSA